MAVEQRDDGATDSSKTEQIIDWFANVERIQVEPDPPNPEAAEDPAAPGPWARFRAATARVGRRYQRLPSWVVLMQICLAAAWARSGLAHGLAADWWSGEQISRFLATETGLRVEAYQFVLVNLIEPLPAVIAAIAVLVELTVAILLLLNLRVPLALGLGAFVNLQLILAGQVSPSVFFLVAAIGLGLWRLETLANPATLKAVSEWSVLVGLVVVAFLVPAVRTLQPAGAIEDPALVLVFLTLLTVGALWWLNRRVTEANQTVAALTDDGQLTAPTPWRLPPIGWVLTSFAAAGAILFVGFTTLRPDAEPTDSVVASTTTPTLGTFDSPYPFGLSVTLNYQDLALDESRSWRVQILERRIDGDSPIQSEPVVSGQLASARIRLSYDEGATVGRGADLSFTAVGPTGAIHPAKLEGCGIPEGRIAGAELEAGQAVEGWICWPVPDDELTDLLVAVEALPADGVLYMSLEE